MALSVQRIAMDEGRDQASETHLKVSAVVDLGELT
eukprot:CAMPEP_0175106082 /NCGR_PEP_ID=MMETSP0086_2-20121207/10955_1 /TAXON_ID=136419 /ORGANISM="Unknown Unknown, Strain D1" /LENGTH=34 /DNA_ID= /DNA_START= /DNA_END= /DNA_ORIENTATION=